MNSSPMRYAQSEPAGGAPSRPVMAGLGAPSRRLIKVDHVWQLDELWTGGVVQGANCRVDTSRLPLILEIDQRYIVDVFYRDMN